MSDSTWLLYDAECSFCTTSAQMFKTTLESLKTNIISELLTYSVMTDSKIVSDKIKPVIEEIRKVNVDIVNDDLISKFLTICQLRKEVKWNLDG